MFQKHNYKCDMRLIASIIVLTMLLHGQRPVDARSDSLAVDDTCMKFDANLDVDRLMSQLTDIRVNVLHFGMGGIAAYYPTKVHYHFASETFLQDVVFR